MIRNLVLTDVQKHRLGVAAQAALDAQKEMFDGMIGTIPYGEAVGLADQAGLAQGVFYHLLNRGALVVGDMVEVLVDGPYKGVVAEVHAFDYANRAELVVGGTTVLVRGSEAKLVTPAPTVES